MSTNYENRIALNPALIVGLGGTGKKSLINFKETFLSSPQIKKAFSQAGGKEPALPDFIDLMCIDTDIFDASQSEEEAKTAAKLTESEYHQINIQNAGQITGNLDSDTYNYLYEWFPQKLKNHIGQISQGAHQFRFTGRFGVFVDVQKIFQQIKTKMSRIMARSNVNQDDIIVPLTNKQGQILTPEFYIVGSLCGGSGAGMFIDIAYLMKMAYYQLSGGRGKPSIIGIMLTPEAFTQIAIDPNVNSTGRLEGNGYASLVETFYFMNKEHFTPSRSAKDIINQDRRNKFMVNYGPVGKSNDATTFGAVCEETPFDQCYLLGTSNQDDIPTYYAIASEFIFTKLATQLRQAQNSMLDNASQILGQSSSDLEGKQLKCFSSAGFKSFYYPLDVIRDLYTFKLSMDLTYWLRLSVDRILIDSMVQEFAENNPGKVDLTPEALFLMTKEVIDRKQFWDNPMFHTLRTTSKQRDGESASAFILRQIDEMNQNRVKKDEIRSKVKVNFEQAAVKTGEQLLEKVIEIINNPDLGAHIAVDFLTAFEKYLLRYPREVLSRKVQEIKVRLDKEQREYREISNRLKERLSGFAGLGGKLMELGTVLRMTDLNDERDKLLKEAKEAVDMEYEMFCIGCAEDYLKFLSVQSQSIKKQVEVFSTKLTRISKDGMIERQYEQCLDRIKPYSKVQNFIRTFIFEDRDIEPFYKYLLGDLSNNDIEGDFLVNINLKENWDKYTNPESSSLEKDIVKYCRNIIERRLFGGIEDFIHWKDSVRKGFKKSLLESLMNQATPLMTLNDRGNNSPQRMNIVTLGIANENSKLSEEIKDALRKGDIGVTVAPTRNPYEISLLQTLHGIAPYNISAITQWHNLYRQNNAKINCHAVLTNDAYPILWSSYGLIPAKKLEEHYMVYLLLRYEMFADDSKTRRGIEYNDELVQFELCYQQDKPQPIGRTITQMFDYLKNNTMGIYLIRSVYSEYWKSLPFPKQREIVSKYLPMMTDKVKKLEDAIEEEIKKNHEVSAASDELLSIKRGILKILQDYNDQFEHILSQRPGGTLETDTATQ
jgi:hypothetical protein